jgi:hypothetical protein
MVKSSGNPNKLTKHSSYRQQGLFLSSEDPAGASLVSEGCQIVSVGKRRDGGTRYWCVRHKADATAKYGVRGEKCRAAHIPPISAEETLELNIDKYEGGIALWGAVPAVYDTTTLPMDRGIHVHARLSASKHKEMDKTFRAVRVLGEDLPEDGIFISEIDAIYYMVSTVFGYETKHIICSFCGHPHLDKDFFSVHPHRRHLCAGCGKHFRDTDTAIGNPILGVREACGVKPQKTKLSSRKLNIKQSDFLGGIQIWGSNPALLWTSDRPEDEGIHVHAFREGAEFPDPDETYGEVIIDGVHLAPIMVRVLMAQSAMPSLKGRIVSVDCTSCGKPHFSVASFLTRRFQNTLADTAEPNLHHLGGCVKQLRILYGIF